MVAAQENRARHKFDRGQMSPIRSARQAVLVRLHVGNFRFAPAKEDGSDLRFVAGDDKTPLKHHIEKFDSLLGEALVWVSIPDLQPGAKSDHLALLRKHEGGCDQRPQGYVRSETALVYHFNERGTPAQDSSVWANGSQSTGQPAEGAMIGTGLRLDGQTRSPCRRRPRSRSPRTDSSLGPLGSNRPRSSLMLPSTVVVKRATNSGHRSRQRRSLRSKSRVNGNVQRSTPALPVAPGGWHHVRWLRRRTRHALSRRQFLCVAQRHAARPQLHCDDRW